MRAYRDNSMETIMIEKLAAGATALVLAAGLSGCIIIDSDGDGT